MPKGNLQLLRDSPANQHVDAQLTQAVDYFLRLFLKQHHFPAIQFGATFEANHQQPRRYIEHGRHTALAIGYRDQHTSCNARFMPAVDYLVKEAILV